MFILFAGLFLFFAARAVFYFCKGRAFAGIFASLACMLFLGAIYTDYAVAKKRGAAETVQPV